MKAVSFLLEILSWWQVNFAKLRILGPTTKADWMFDDTTKASPEGRVVKSQSRRSTGGGTRKDEKGAIFKQSVRSSCLEKKVLRCALTGKRHRQSQTSAGVVGSRAPTG